MRTSTRMGALIVGAGLLFGASPSAAEPSLEQALLKEGPHSLAQAAIIEGDAQRGAILFHQPHMACAKCHATGEGDESLGPDLTRLGEDVSDAHVIESVLDPSKVIRKGYEPVTVLTEDGRSITGLVVEDSAERLVLRDVADGGRQIVIPAGDIAARKVSPTSLMPAGQVSQLASRQQFLDLARYLIEIRRGGRERARELRPPASAIVLEVPEYEQHIDHAGLIADLDDASLERGSAIYNRLCVNCHGTHDRPGTLPTALRFAEGRFKNGSDPYSMYRTLTYGFGMMVPQTWMVPRQKYDVIHYIREAYLKEHNPAERSAVTDEYLAGLPEGDTRGPEPTTLEPWVTMDYGPSLINTYEIGSDGENFAQKGIAVRLDSGPGGVSQGRAWMIFDHDTLRVAAAWTGKGFIDWNGIHFNGRHQVHPRVVGDVHFANPTGPGWANPETGDFRDEDRVRGRDGRMYGPLPKAWGRYEGLYHHENEVVIAYAVDGVPVLETPGMTTVGADAIFTRTFNIGPRPGEMVLQAAHHPYRSAALREAAAGDAPPGSVVIFGPADHPREETKAERFSFSGNVWIEPAGAADFEMTRRDYTLAARIRTREGGTIFAQTAPGEKWVPDGKALFVRNGRLCFDIGWVGVVESRRRVNDGRWHDVALTWDQRTATASLYIDGEPDARKKLRPRDEAEEHVVRIGLAAPNFPQPATFFTGEIEEVRFYPRLLDEAAIDSLFKSRGAAASARWRFTEAPQDGVFTDLTQNGHDATVRTHGTAADSAAPLAAGISPPLAGVRWLATDEGDLRLRIPAGENPLRFTLWMARAESGNILRIVEKAAAGDPARDLTPLARGGRPHWPQPISTEPAIGNEDGPFAVDVLTLPAENPWSAQTRLSGCDFFPGGDRAAVCSWDGDVWLVTGLNQLPESSAQEDGRDPPQLTWRRIASGLFQPLGLKIIDDRIYVGCRDQIAVLHDRNGDGETDFVENFNNDHQVTEHFHEFAAGLQTDDEGNLYYAKAARHALPAVVPQHGTLLRVSGDGRRTEIVATGFRAPNGVCVNGDGTFVATDQEGHWTPKNRINWIREGGFYGNMLGYHGVTDPADEAMQPPLCWVTNEFDRSPSEPLWVDSSAWGPLSSSLLNLSYGYGEIHVVLHERAGDRMQGGVCKLPIPQLPTGIMRGRFHPVDGQLYTCGMFAWGGARQTPGGFYRIRYTGKPLHMPVKLNARPDGVAVTFTEPLDPDAAADIENYSVKTWSLKRSARYGSDHHDEQARKIESAQLAGDGRTVVLRIREIEPTWCMAIEYSLSSASGDRVAGEIHSTIHALPE